MICFLLVFQNNFVPAMCVQELKAVLSPPLVFWASTLDAPQFTLDTISHDYSVLSLI